jgi:hypothetical protein
MAVERVTNHAVSAGESANNFLRKRATHLVVECRGRTLFCPYYPFRELRAGRPKQKTTGYAGGSQKLIEIGNHSV